VTVRRPGLFNEALAGFYRATETEARRRAEAAQDPAALTHPPVEDIPGIDETDAHWLDGRRPEGEPR
jgi:hypothetical protein